MINAVVSADSFTAGDTVETGAGTTVAVTTRAATPIDTVTRVAMGRNIADSQRDRQNTDATDVLRGTHHPSSTWVLAKRWPTASGVEFREGNFPRVRCEGAQ